VSRYIVFFQFGKMADRAVAKDNFAHVDWLWARWAPTYTPSAAHPDHVKATIKQATGLPPHRLRLMMRLERAKEMLADPRFTIADVAAHIGYDDQSQLARLFQREVGISPSSFRRDLRS